MVDATNTNTDRRRREWLSYNEDPETFKMSEGNRKYNTFTTIKTQMMSCDANLAVSARTFLDDYFAKKYSLYHLVILNRMVKFEYWQYVVDSAHADDFLGDGRFTDFIKNVIDDNPEIVNPSYRPRTQASGSTTTLTSDFRGLADQTLKTLQDRLTEMISEIDTLRQLISEDSDDSA